MAKVEIDTNGVTVRIEDGDAGSDVLAARALALYQQAVAVDATLPTGPASGGQAERRGTPTHTDPNYVSGIGFSPVKAEGRNDG